MGLFGDGLTNEERKQKEIEETLAKYNIFEGIQCEVVFPEKQLKTSGSSGTKKGLATLAFGVIGWAATSGTSQNEENRVVPTIFQIVDKGIVFKNASVDGSDTRIPYDNIIKMEAIWPRDDHSYGLISLLKNKKILIKPTAGQKNHIINKHASDIINERACGAQYEEAGWGLEHATAETPETKQETESLMDELERLGNMYEKGLLTEEEFTLAKKKLLEGE